MIVAVFVAQMELDTQSLLTIEQIREDLYHLLGRQIISLDADTKAGDDAYPVLCISLLLELVQDDIQEIRTIFEKLHKLYDHVDGIIYIACREFSGVAGKRSFKNGTGGRLFFP
jgi:hypothetical protein